jgi:Xaa-Pro aminopeptidase
MGHVQHQIAIETTPFPQGTKGDKLDPLARQFLWREGLNFGHGVGHGIGSYLSCVPPESCHIERVV